MSEVQRLAALVTKLQGDVASLARERRLASASMEGGAVNVYQPGTKGRPGVQLGQQFDGTYAPVPLGGPSPGTPSLPTAVGGNETLVVRWNGFWAGSYLVVAPMDFARVEVHAATTPQFDALSADTLRGTIESPRGGELTIGGLAPGDYYVRLVARTLSGKYSSATAAAGPFTVRADAATALAASQDATTTAQTAATKADSAERTALDAAGIAADAGKIVYTETAPVGDAKTLWVPPPDNVPRKWDGAAWVPIPDAGVKAAADRAAAAELAAQDAAAAAQTAQNAANAAQGKATTAQDTADGKNTVTYSTAAPATSTPGIRAGDIWWKRDASGVVRGTWQWDGAAWQPASFGNEVLDSLTVGKLTAGTLSADVVVAGRVATALSGARTELNASGLQKFADDGVTRLVSITGTEALLTGLYRTAVDGRRIEMGSAGSMSQIDFWAPSGNRTFIRSYTEADGKEAIQIGHGDPTTRGLDERININTAGWFTSRFRRTDFVVGESWNLFGAAMSAGDRFMGYNSAARELVWENIGNSFHYLTNQTIVGLGAEVHEQNDGFTWRVRPAANVEVDVKFAKDGRLGGFYGADAYYGGWWQFMEATQAYTTSPKIGLFTNDGYGGYMRFNGDATYQDMEFKYFDDSFYINTVARAFVVASDEAGKEAVTDIDIDCLAEVGKAKVKKYKRTAMDRQKRVRERSEEIGLIAQEAPPQIVHDNGAAGSLGIDLYQMGALLWGAVQQLSDRLDALDGNGRAPKARGGM